MQFAATGRRGRIVILLLAVIGLGAGLSTSAAPAAAAEAPELQFLQLTNDARASRGLPALQMVEPLNAVAEDWSQRMAAAGTLSHRPDLVVQVQPFAPSWSRLGENVAYGGSLPAIQSAFMNSAPHAANILGDYNFVGIGVVASGDQLWVTVNFLKHPAPLPGTVVVDTVSAIRPDGVLATAPDLAAARGGSRLDTVAVGSDGQVYWSGSAGGAFSGWQSLGRPAPGIQGQPSIVSWSPGRLDVFARGGDNRLWQAFSTDSGATWSPWFQPVGASGLLASSPEASSWGPGRLDVFVLGTDGRIYQRFYQDGWSGGWVDHGTPPAGVAGMPAAASWAPGRVDLFVRGNDSRLWQRFWDGSRWSTWIRPPGDTGTLASSPSATSSAPGRLSVVTRGADDGVYALTFAGGWLGWRRVGTASNVVTDAPAAASRGFGELQIAGRGSDALAYLFSTTG